MNPQLYQEFLDEKHRDKTRARFALSEFIASFENDEEKESWTREFLESGEFSHKIRYEIYREIIFPVLLRGYHANDAWAILQLARTANNLVDDSDLHSRINFDAPMQLLKESYMLDPNEAARIEILQSELRFFAYSAHEWPAGILWDNNGATLEQCQELLDDIQSTRNLDKDKAYETILDDYENKVQEYQQRLISRQNEI